MKDKGKACYIGDTAKDIGLSQRTIRYYEELGFIRPTRTEGRFRNYSEKDLDLLRLIVQFKNLGMSLEDIRSLFIPGKEGLSAPALRNLREKLSSRREQIQLKIGACQKGLQQIDRVLAILSNCSDCGQPALKGRCDACLQQRGGGASPLIAPLFDRGAAEKE